MLQVCSSNLTIAANTPYPFENVVISKGCAEKLSAPATIQLNKRGVYLVEVDGFNTPAAAGEVSAQLYVNGVAQPQAISSFTGATDTIGALGFKTFVQVNENNCNCNCYASPTVLQVVNGETAIESAHINVVVTKIC